jgi:hypothetical protein
MRVSITQLLEGMSDMPGFSFGGGAAAGGAPNFGGAPSTPSLNGSASGFFDDPTKLGWAKLLVDLAGGVAGGVAESKMSAAEIAERQREFDKSYGLQAGNAATGAQRQLDASPMRDRVMYKLQQVLGQTPGDFKPHDIFNGGGVAQRGGYDTGKLQAADAAYKPGAGGVNTDVIKKFLASLGYPAPSDATDGSLLPPSRIPKGVTL